MMASRGKYTSGRPVVDAFERHMAALRTLPGVRVVGATGAPPLSGGADQSGARFPTSPTNTGKPEHDALLVDTSPATTGYFTAMGIDILAGTEFGSAQRDSAGARVAIIDDLLAKRFFPNGNAVGQPITIDGDTLRIIGVARHVRMYNLQDVGREQVWVTHTYTPYRGLVVSLRTNGDPTALASAARRTIRSVDPDQAIIDIAPMTDAIRQSLAQRRLVLTLVGTFAGAALLLAALGVYGVTANSVSQRTREIGIRMALGANRRRVIWSILSEPTRLVVFGLVIGLAGTYAAGRVVQKLLYGTSPTDPLTLIGVALVLTLVGVIASYFPARRATRVDPMVALRSE
jgi:predicted permease